MSKNTNAHSLWLLPFLILLAVLPLCAAESPVPDVSSRSSLSTGQKTRPDIALTTQNSAPAGHGQVFVGHLTPEESAWLATRQRVRVAVFDLPPYSDRVEDEDNPISGMAGDYLQILSSFLGITFVPVPVDNLNAAYAALAANTADMTALATQSDSSRSVLFCPWLTTRTAIATRNHTELTDLEKLRGTTVAVIKHGHVGEMLAKFYPDVKLLELDSTEQCLLAIIQGKALAAVSLLESLNFYVRHSLMEGITVLPTTQNLAFGFGVRADHPELASLLGKGMSAIPRETYSRVYTQWVQMQKLSSSNQATFWWRYTITGIFSLVAFVASAVMFWRKIREHAKENRKSRNIINSMFTFVPAAIALFDADMRCLGTNDMAVNSYSLPSDHEGKTLVETAATAGLPDGCLPELQQLQDTGFKAFETKDCLTVKTTRKIDEAARYLNTTCMPLFNEHGKPESLIMLSMDITENVLLETELRRALLEAEQAFLTKTYFLAHMSHELRTPINGILNLSNLLHRDARDARTRDFLEKISYSTRNLLAIVENILTFSEMNSNNLVLKHSAFSLREVMRTLRTMLAEAVSAKSLSLHVTADSAVPDKLIGDSARLTQVLFALTDNAVKYTDTGSVRAHFSVAERDGQSCLLHFEVTDTGIGMSEATAAGVFEPFAQGESNMTRKYGGTGLGLSIAAKLVNAMQGSINCESREGQGSRFYFTARFDIDAEDTAEIAAEDSSRQPESVSGEADVTSDIIRGKRILLAEDNPINQLVAQEILAAFGAEIDTADDGEEAVRMADKKDYDCILMDIQMPRMDGLAATRAIKQNPVKSRIPIVALTAHTSDEDRRLSLEAGMEEHLTKPIDPNALRAVLESVLVSVA